MIIIIIMYLLYIVESFTSLPSVSIDTDTVYIY